MVSLEDDHTAEWMTGRLGVANLSTTASFTVVTVVKLWVFCPLCFLFSYLCVIRDTPMKALPAKPFWSSCPMEFDDSNLACLWHMKKDTPHKLKGKRGKAKTFEIWAKYFFSPFKLP